jgi:hypothetical protein
VTAWTKGTRPTTPTSGAAATAPLGLHVPEWRLRRWRFCSGAGVSFVLKASLPPGTTLLFFERSARLAGWPCRIRTGESVRALSNWNCVTTSPGSRRKPGRMGALCTSRHFAGGPLQGALETDWLAGHLGFEPANPSASYVIGIAWQLRLRWAQGCRRDPSRVSCVIRAARCATGSGRAAAITASSSASDKRSGARRVSALMSNKLI